MRAGWSNYDLVLELPDHFVLGEVFMQSDFDVLPDWLRERLDEMFCALENELKDEEFVRRHVDEGTGCLVIGGMPPSMGSTS
jgi:hypothetical protein